MPDIAAAYAYLKARDDAQRPQRPTPPVLIGGNGNGDTTIDLSKMTRAQRDRTMAAIATARLSD